MSSVTTVATVTFDNVIYSVQSARGATMYWHHLLDELARRDDIRVIERPSRSKYDRYIPLVGVHGIVHTSLFRWPVQRQACQLVMTAHDLAYERGFIPGRRATVGRVERRLAVRHAAGIIAVSNATRDDLQDYYGSLIGDQPIMVAQHGPSVPIDRHHRVGLDNPGSHRLLLHVGHRDAYKNFASLAAAYDRTPPGERPMSLLVVGPPPGPHESMMSFEAKSAQGWTLPTRPGIRYLGRVTDQELSGLYQLVDGVVCPSQFEGFGFPVLDALHHGCKVWCSAIAPHVEIAGNLASYFDPDDIESIGSSLAGETSLPIDVTDQMARRFSWDRSAANHVELYHAVHRRAT